MMNWTPELKMEPVKFDSSQLAMALQKAPKISLPANTKIFVYTGNLGYLPKEHYTTVQSFWKSYFNQNNLEVIDYSSGSLSALQKAISGQ